MSKDFNDDQGGIQSSNSTQFAPIESDVPKSGISEAPASELAPTAAGPGVGNSRRGIR